MDDKTLAQRLRDSFVYDQSHYAADPLIEEAADRIEMLERAVDAATEQAIDTIEALQARVDVLEAEIRRYMGVHGVLTQDDRDRLRRVLEGKSNG